jgi:hypothetical protein
MKNYKFSSINPWAGLSLVAMTLCFPTTILAENTIKADDTEQLAQHLLQLQQQVEKLSKEVEDSKYKLSARQQVESPIVNTKVMDRLQVKGDARLRYESTTNQPGVSDRDRAVMRARVGIKYDFTDKITLGARLTTGNSQDPNSTDTTMGDFVDDLEVSFDMAFAEYNGENYRVTAGKFANPFIKQDLVWDGDVNPFGIAANYNYQLSETLSGKVTGIYSIIDEQVELDDSYMFGIQASVNYALNKNWNATFSSAYYDYAIGSLANTDSGDIRGNILDGDGLDYLSDFDLFDTILILEYKGFGERYPVRISGDYVHNFGAEVNQNDGFSIDFGLGRNKEVGDWKVEYGYILNETDAVLTAFSHDNTTYASNYRQHTFLLSYTPLKDVLLNLTTYIYRRDQFTVDDPNDWDNYISRVRLNLSFAF